MFYFYTQYAFFLLIFLLSLLFFFFPPFLSEQNNKDRMFQVFISSLVSHLPSVACVNSQHITRTLKAFSGHFVQIENPYIHWMRLDKVVLHSLTHTIPTVHPYIFLSFLWYVDDMMSECLYCKFYNPLNSWQCSGFVISCVMYQQLQQMTLHFHMLWSDCSTFNIICYSKLEKGSLGILF